MRFCVYLVEQGILTEHQFYRVLQRISHETPPLGRLIVKERLLGLAELRELLAVQADLGRPLGRLAVERGLLTDLQVRRLLDLQRDETPSEISMLSRLGVLPPEVLAEANGRFLSTMQ